MSTGTATRLAAPHDLLIEQRLARSRWQLRLVDAISALMSLAAAVLGFLLLFAVVDHWGGDLGVAGRWVAWCGLVFGSLAFGTWLLAPALFRRINPVYLAQAIEQGTPSLKNSLINFLLFREHRTEIREAVYDALRERAALDLDHVPAEQAVDRANVIRIGYLLAAVMAIGAVYTVLSPKSLFRSAARLAAPWADLARPSIVQVEDVQPGDATVFFGQRVDVSCLVRSNGADVPVTLYLSTADGQIVDRAVSLEPDTARLRFSTKLPPGDDGLQQDVLYRIEAGDCVTTTYRLTVLPAPTIFVERLEYRPLRYTKLPPRSAEHEADIKGLEGTRVTVHAVANQPIRSAYVEFDTGRGTSGTPGRSSETRTTAMIVDGQKARLTFPLELTDDRRTPQYASYQVRFVTEQGQRSTSPTFHRIEVTPDLAPEVEILSPRESVVQVAENGRLPIEMRALDPDFGLRRVTLRAHRAEGTPGAAALETKLFDDPTGAGRLGQHVATYPFEPQRLRLRAGDKVAYSVTAEDNRTTATDAPAPNVTKTRDYYIEITAAKTAGDGQPSGRSGDTPAGPNASRRPGEAASGAEGNPSKPTKPENANANSANAQNSNTPNSPNNSGSNASNSNTSNGGTSGSNSQNGQRSPSEGAKSGENSKNGSNTGTTGGEKNAGENSTGSKTGSENSGGQSQKNGPSSGSEAQSGRSDQSNQSDRSDQSGSSAGQQNASGQQNATGQQSPSGQQNSSGQQGNRDSLHDGEALERILEHMKKSGNSGEQSGAGSQSQSPQQSNQNSPPSGGSAGQQNSPSNSGSKPQGDSSSGSSSQQKPSGAQQSSESPSPSAGGNNANQPGEKNGGQQPSSGGSASQEQKSPKGSSGQSKPGSSGAGEKQGGQQSQSSQEKQSGGGSDNQQDKNHGANSSKQEGSSGQGGQPQGAMKSGHERPSGQQSGSQNADQPKQGGQAQNGQSGQGQQNQTKSGSAQSESIQDRPKSQQSGGSKPSQGNSPSSKNESKKQSDSKGGENGDRSGGGKQGGGQGSQQSGNDSAGGTSSADQGAGRSSESGQGDTANRPGGRQTNDAATGDAQAPVKGAGQRTNQGGTSTGGKANGTPQGGTQDPSDAEGDPTDASDSTPAKPGTPNQPPTGQQRPGSGGVPIGGGRAGDQEPPPTKLPTEVPDGEKANLEYTRKATEMALRYLKEQQDNPDRRLLDELNWTPEELRAYLARWEQLQRGAQQTPQGKREWIENLRSLGLRPDSQLRRGAERNDQQRGLRDAGSSGTPPAKYAEQFDAFRKGTARTER